ncbi:MAG: hypothetical protein ACOC88_01815 [Candidatus Bipolaricaulota bacterium]
MSAKRKFVLVALLLAALPVILPGVAQGYSESQLETLANSDFITEVRAAASQALIKLYAERDISIEELKVTAGTARTEDLRNAAKSALVKKYEDVKEISSLEEVKKKTKEMERQTAAGESPELREASSKALGLFYLALNLNNVSGYSMEELEEIATGGAEELIRLAAADALGSIYPNYYFAEDLKEIIATSESDLIKEAAATALSIRYYTQMSPNLSVEELEEIATSVEEDRWLRRAAGRAYGKLAWKEVDPKDVKDLVIEGRTEEIRRGASDAWTKYLINSDKSETELLRMACAATEVSPGEYKDAVVSALAERMLRKSAEKEGAK